MKSSVCHSMRALLCIFAVLAASSSHAAFRSFLSKAGTDNPNCFITAPCRLLPAALLAVNDGGEIWMLDSANFNDSNVGTVTITKSVKILAIPGEMGSVLGSNGDAIVINAPGKDVTLRNLVVLNFGGGINGIRIQDAAAVHIEKTSIDGFNTDASSCIRLNSSTTVRVYVVDSFIRACRNGIYANGTVTLANVPSVIIDNTRIERGRGTAPTVGIWMQGNMDVSLRNSMISRQDVGIQFDNLLPSSNSHLNVINSEITRINVGLQHTNSAASGQVTIVVTGSQIIQAVNCMQIVSTAVGGNTKVTLTDSQIGQCGSGAVQLSNSASDANSRVSLDLIRSDITHSGPFSVSLGGTNGSKAYLDARDSTFGFADSLIKTTGTFAKVSLIRSNLHRATIGIDHGAGTVRLDGSHFVTLANDFVNNGSGNIVSAGNNFVHDVDNLSGFLYITPTVIPLK